MSSTNRGYDRHQSDYYVTPVQPIRDFLSAFLLAESQEPDYIKIIDRPDTALWLDPCAGGDDTHAMSYPSIILKEFGAEVTTIDIREDSPAEIHTDYLSDGVFTGYDYIITNPPFYAAREIIEKALKDVNRGGYVIMLLRLNFLGSKSRFDFWQNHMPKYIFVHHSRMSFTADGKTDSIEYAHFVWQKGTEPEFAKVQVV